MLTSTSIRTTKLPSGERVPVLGQGTWHIGEGRHSRAHEISALRTGLDLGMTLIDTAEMYGDGRAEELVGDAVEGRRDQVFLVSKVLPSHATTAGTIRACEESLERLKTEWIDLYLLHWRESIPLWQTIDGFRELERAEKIRYWGVSNFDTADMLELMNLDNGQDVATDQVLYNLSRRGIEFDLLPWCHRHKVPVMAYSPIEQGRLLHHSAIHAIAKRHDASPTQIALAWVIHRDGVIAIPQAGVPEHVHENRKAVDIVLTEKDLAQLDTAFPPPTEKQPLEML
jgi:diketogulonate reductase-like aldo/keto reductase